MKKISFFRRIFPLFVVLCAFLVSVPVIAQGEVTYYDPITEIDLGVHELTMEVGETCVFPLTHLPEETPNVFLTWYADDETVTVNPEELSVTALAAGTTRVLVESNVGFAFDFCDITVVGEKSADKPEGKAGNQMLTLSDEAREKILADTVNHYIEFIEKANLSGDNFVKFGTRQFNVTADVQPGTSAAQTQRALDLGFEKAVDLPDLNGVSLRGTLLQILDFVTDNSDLNFIFEFAPMPFPKPVQEYDSGNLDAKTMNLESNVEAITHVSVAHNKGYTGRGTVIAVIDTGIDANHKEFAGRVKHEICAGLTDGNTTPVCVPGSSAPSLAQNPDQYNHGSHVTGIAAGAGGIAPDTGIVSVSDAVQTCVNSKCSSATLANFWEIAQQLVNLQKTYRQNGEPLIVAVNMSFGDKFHLFTDPCDSDSSVYIEYKKAIDLLADNEIISVASSGNEGYDYYMQAPACISSVFQVGQLTDDARPKISANSNHNQYVDILAPGEDIRSAFYAWEANCNSTCDDGSAPGSKNNCYGEYSGTSMATPVVTGAFALLKQAYPNLNTFQLKNVIKNMSTLTVNNRVSGYARRFNYYGNPYIAFVPEQTFSYIKPVLTFDNIGNTPDTNWYPDKQAGQEFTLYPITPKLPAADITAPVQPEKTMNPIINWPSLPKLPATGISASVLPEKPMDLNYKNLNWNLQIPSISVSADIVEVPLRDDEYEVTWLGNKAGLLAGLPLPGEGTTVIAGHNHLNAEEAGPFAMLQFVNEGDLIIIQNPENDNQSYVVYANEKIAETDFEAFDRIAGAQKNAVVFITCEDERIEGGYANRRIVAAMPK